MEFNYLVEKKRMLNSLGRRSGLCDGVDCENCPLNMTDFYCDKLEGEHPLEATEIVRKWAEEHPRKTRLEILLEAFPNAPIKNDGNPEACCISLGLCNQCGNPHECEKCWNTEVEE